MLGRARPRRAFPTSTTLARRLASLVAVVAVSAGVAVLEASADDTDEPDEVDELTVAPADLLAGRDLGDGTDLTGSLARSLWTPRGLSPQAPPPGVDEHAPSGATTAAVVTVWDRLAQCESNGRWHLDSGNGFYGGLQFTLRSWRAVGGSGAPNEHPREVQILKAERLQAKQGWGAWPACSRKLGLGS